MIKEQAIEKISDNERGCYILFIRFNESVDEETRENILQKFYDDNVDLLDGVEYNETMTEKIFNEYFDIGELV